MIHRINGHEFEALILNRAKKDERRGRYTLSRYGTITTLINGSWRPIPSLPDFEGVLPGGRQFIFDAKVCSQASFQLTGNTAKSFRARQFGHLMKRSEYGVETFILIHFNYRKLKTKQDDELTVAIPVKENKFWNGVIDGTIKKIGRDVAIQIGTMVPWNKFSKRCGLETPDLYFYLNLKEKK